MRFQEYILEYKKESRGKSLTLDEIVKLTPQYSDAVKILEKGGVSMVRALDFSLSNYRYIDPSKGEKRVSRNTMNYYTLIVDNSKNWAKYPKRSKSIICLAEKYQSMADFYYVVLPKNGAKIGECSARDFWFSFQAGKAHINSMEDFSQELKVLLNVHVIDPELIEHLDIMSLVKFQELLKSTKLKDFDNNLNEFKKACKNFDKWFKWQNKLSIKDMKKPFSLWFARWKGEPLYSYLDIILEAKGNGFRITNVKNLTENKEVWTDSECLMVQYLKVGEFLQGLSI